MTQTKSLSLFSPAKINLFLHITGKRDDGYHNLQTVFRLLNWGDNLHFFVTSQTFNPQKAIDASNSPILLESNIKLTANPSDNLIIKAATALLTWMQAERNKHVLPSTLPIINIKLNKQLPTGAGLGGGSSNAASTLMGLNKLWQLNLPQETLIKISSQVGADVPIFIFAQDAIAEGIGEQLIPIMLPEQHYLLLNPSMQNPKAHASTQALFSHPDLQRNISPINVNEIVHQQRHYSDCLTAPYCNVFEPIVKKLVPEVQQALDYLHNLEQLTQTTPRLTGSGSSVFLPIPKQHLTQIKTLIAENFPPPCHTILTSTI